MLKLKIPNSSFPWKFNDKNPILDEFSLIRSIIPTNGVQFPSHDVKNDGIPEIEEHPDNIISSNCLLKFDFRKVISSENVQEQ